MNNVNYGVNDTEEGFHLYKKFKIRLSEASLIIKKWRTNKGTLRKSIQECEGSNDEKLK